MRLRVRRLLRVPLWCAWDVSFGAVRPHRSPDLSYSSAGRGRLRGHLSLLLDGTVMPGALCLVRLPPLTAQLEVRVEVVVAPVVNAPWRHRGPLLLRRATPLAIRIVRVLLGKGRRSDDDGESGDSK